MGIMRPNMKGKPLCPPEIHRNHQRKGVLYITPRKERALQALLVSRTRAEAAKAAGIGESTLREYIKDPEFSAAYKQAAAELLNSATMQLRQNLTAAIDRLGQIVTDDTEASPAQISAARTLLDFNLKFTELTDVLDRLTELERWKDESNG